MDHHHHEQQQQQQQRPTARIRRRRALWLPVLLSLLGGAAEAAAAASSSSHHRLSAAFLPSPLSVSVSQRQRPSGRPSVRVGAKGGGDDDRRAKAEKQRKEKEKLAALMAKQEREAVKKYMETQARKEASAAERTRRAQEEMAARAKGKTKDAPWAKSGGKDGGKGDGASGSPPPPPQRKPKPKFQQVTLTCRPFSIDDIQDVTFEGSHLMDVPFLGLPEIAVFGRSNVGKSSLLNCLTGRQKSVAVVSKTPGRTQQINLFKVHDSNGPVAVLVDLPGYGYAKLPKALQSDIGAQVRTYLSDRPTLRLAVLLMDSRREPQKADLNMMKYFRAANVPLLVLATKVDKLKLEEIEPNLSALHRYFRLPEGMPVPFSSVTGLNRRTVWNAIRDACVGEYMDAEGNEVE